MIKYIAFLFFSFIFLETRAGTKCSQIDYGSKDAPLKITEYASPSCTICSEFSKVIFPKLLPYIQAKKIMLRVVNLPYNMVDLKACTLITHSPDPKKMNTFVYQNQKEWLFSKDPVRALGALLEGQGMSRAHIRAALRNTKRENKIIKERVDAEQKHDIQAIPIIIIGQKKIIGLMPWDKLKLVIEEAFRHIEKGNPLATFGQEDDKKLKRKTPTPKKRNSIEN
jgi:predicted DsbA family dithiol-disulfide isomerase